MLKVAYGPPKKVMETGNILTFSNTENLRGYSHFLSLDSSLEILLPACWTVKSKIT